jgi:M6 family metalloprotease-like protein
LIVLVRFADHADKILPEPEEYNILLNGKDANPSWSSTDSVADVFWANSYGTFFFDAVVTDWIDVSLTELEVSGGKIGRATSTGAAAYREALQKLDSAPYDVDFSDFDSNGDGIVDALGFVHSGAPAEVGGVDCENTQGLNFTHRIWSHYTKGTIFTSNENVVNGGFMVASGVQGLCPPGGAGNKWKINAIGTFAHELGHSLGLPDMYDGTIGCGVGFYDLMG